MNRTLISLLTLGALAGAADFSYVERAQMTGDAHEWPHIPIIRSLRWAASPPRHLESTPV